MYKPGTQLIITDLWAAAAAHKLGFEVGISVTYNGETLTLEWEEYLSDNLYANLLYPDDDCKIKVFITVTESGPNAAEKFLPQVGDILEINEGEGVHVVTVTYTSEAGVVMVLDVPWEDTWPLNIKNHCRRIIKRDGIPFPQFSEVIEP
jgi:broad specificity phosphatase PhoE